MKRLAHVLTCLAVIEVSTTMPLLAQTGVETTADNKPAVQRLLRDVSRKSDSMRDWQMSNFNDGAQLKKSLEVPSPKDQKPSEPTANAAIIDAAKASPRLLDFFSPNKEPRDSKESSKTSTFDKSLGATLDPKLLEPPISKQSRDELTQPWTLICGSLEIVPGVRANSQWTIELTELKSLQKRLIHVDYEGNFSGSLQAGIYKMLPLRPVSPRDSHDSDRRCIASIVSALPNQPAINLGKIQAMNPASIAGKIYGLSQEELAQSAVFVVQNFTLVAATKPNPDGTYILNNLAPGIVSVTVQVPDDNQNRFQSRRMQKGFGIAPSQMVVGCDIEFSSSRP